MTQNPADLPSPLAARVGEVIVTRHRMAFAEIGPDLTLQAHSPRFETLLGEVAPLAPGQPLTEWLWELVGSEAELTALLRGERSEWTLEHVNRVQPDGKLRYLTFVVLPRHPERPADGLLLVIEDVTAVGELQQALVQERNQFRLAQTQLARTNDKLQQINRFKSLLLSMAAHDLRSPLTIVHGYIELLLEEWATPDSEQGEMLSLMQSQVSQLTHMLTTLLDLDQIEQGRLQLHPVPCDITALLVETIRPLRALAQLQNQTLALTLPTTPIYLEADPNRLRQIVHNLLSNALKYTPEGGQISCTLEVDPAVAPPQAVIRVTDTGRGMTPAQVASLFQPYYRTEEARRSSTRGTGLGLYIVKMLLEAHGGQIEIDSQPGVGTTVTLRLPVARRGVTSDE